MFANPSETGQTGPIFDEYWFCRILMKYPQLLILIFLLSILHITGCKKSIVTNEKQAILFQVDYVNYAWGYQHNGFILDGDGIVYTYKNPPDWNFPDKDFNISENEVEDNIRNCTYSGQKIPSEELKKHAGYIRNISLSKITALKNVAADAGSLEYTCYQFSEKTDTYKGCLIKMEGDFTCENLNFYSKKVTGWLRSVKDTIEKK